jgi:hypothetical protein
MSNPRFTAHMLVHWVGPPVAAFDLWEPLRTGLDLDRFDGFDACDDAEFVYERAIEMLMDDPIAAHMKTGDVVVMSLAGTLNYHTYNTLEGLESDMDVEIEWHHFRILNAEERQAAVDAEFGAAYPAPDQVMTTVPLSFTFNVASGNTGSTTTQSVYQPFYTKIGNQGI